jgi:hypothetical protein
MKVSSRSIVLGMAAVLGVAGPSRAASVPVAALGASLTAQGNYGTIKGRLVWDGGDVPAPKNAVEKGQTNLAAQKDPNVCAKDTPIPDRSLVVDAKTKGVRYGIAYLVRPQGANPDAVKAILAKAPKAEVDQKNCEFIPYVTPMLQDQGLILKSSDPVNHNVRLATFTNAAFNQILPPNGQVELKLVAERRPIGMACDIHPWMKGYIMVFDHPFFAVTGEDGSFTIEGVPAGAQKLVLWQSEVGYVNPGMGSGMPVEVKAGGTTDVGEVKLKPKK